MKSVFEPRRDAGVTLVELVISIVILGIALTAVLSSFSVSIGQSADPLWRNKTLKLGQLYLDEILSKAYDHGTPVGGMPLVPAPDCSDAYLGPDGETRPSFNDVDDYDDFTEAPPNRLSTGGSGLETIPGYEDYSVAINVECGGSSVDAENTAGAVSNAHAKLITVTITAPNGKDLALSAFKGNY